MPRVPFAALLAFAALSAAAQPQNPPSQGEAPVQGRIQDDRYYSPTGTFSVAIPVLPELGRRITEAADGHVVTFHDNYSVDVSIAAYPQDATEKWQLQTRGIKDYLAYYFTEFVLSDFAKMFPGMTYDPDAIFTPGLMEGALYTYVLLPGGSMFADQLFQFVPSKHPPVAKRGNLLFVKNGVVYVISIELAERVLEGSLYQRTPHEENLLLRERLNEVLDGMQFAPAPPEAAKEAGPAGG